MDKVYCNVMFSSTTGNARLAHPESILDQKIMLTVL